MKLASTLLFFAGFSALGVAAVFVLTGYDTGTLMWSVLGLSVILTVLGVFGVRHVKSQERATTNQ